MSSTTKLSAAYLTGLVALFVIPLMFSFSYTLDNLQRSEKRQSLQNRAENQFQKIRTALAEITTVLQGSRSLLELNPNLSRQQFDYYISTQKVADYGISAFEWVEKVKFKNSANWQQSVRDQGQFDFTIDIDLTRQHPLLPDPFIIKYSSSNQMEALNNGRNLAQEIAISANLAKALKNPSLQLVLSEQADGASRFLLPSYSSNMVNYSQLLGFVSAVINVEESISVLLGNTLEELELCLQVSRYFTDQEKIIYRSSKDTKCPDMTRDKRWRILYTLGGETLFFDFYSNPLQNQQAINTAGIAMIAAIFSVLLGLFYLYNSRRSSLRIEQLMDEKQQRLHNITQDYSQLLMLSVDGIYRASLQGDLITFNPAFAKAFDYSEMQLSDVQIKSIESELYYDKARYQIFLQQLIRDNKVLNFEWRGKSAQGENVWLVENAYLVELEGQTSYYEGFISVITERKNAELKLQYQAQYDALTGLQNRPYFVQSLQDHIDSQSEYNSAVLFIDIDRFKTINDTFGHAVGDQLLIEIARRLKHSFNSHNIARFGGDEFALLIDLDKQTSPIKQLTEHALEKIGHEVYISADIHFSISASIGISLLSNQCNTVSEALHQADLAMYEVKNSGRSNIAVFDHLMCQKIQRRLNLEIQLKDALSHGELSLNYQPIINMETSKVCGFEALMRWHNEPLGQISPSEFIPLLEELNLIIAAGNWAIDYAIRDLKNIINQTSNDSLFVNVNVSPKQLTCYDTANVIKSKIAQYGIRPCQLRIEVTESKIYSDEDTLITQLQAIRALGVKVYIDDFGTGHSSLERLVKHPLDGIKLDRSFVEKLASDCSSEVVLKASIKMARTLGLTVTAEGIEHHYQHRFFQSLDCQYGQGYLFHKPMNAKALLQLIASPQESNTQDRHAFN